MGGKKRGRFGTLSEDRDLVLLVVGRGEEQIKTEHEGEREGGEQKLAEGEGHGKGGRVMEKGEGHGKGGGGQKRRGLKAQWVKRVGEEEVARATALGRRRGRLGGKGQVVMVRRVKGKQGGGG